MSASDETAMADPPHPRRPRRLRLIIGIIVVVLIALVLWHILAQPAAKHPNPPQAVTVARVVRGDMPVTLDEIGTVTPIATVTVLPNSNVSGYLLEVPFREGQLVRKGQLLALIDPRPYEVLRQQAVAALAKDQATLNQARYDLGLYNTLNAKQAIAKQTFADQQFAVQQNVATVQSDRANIAQYTLDITYCHITAPVSGRAGLRQVDPGNYITGSSSTGITVITTMQPMLVQFGVAQNDIGRVSSRYAAPGVKLPVTAIDSSSNQSLATGTIYAIGNQMNTATGQTLMRASFANANQALWPNAFVNVRVAVDTLHAALLVPTPAVLTGAPGTYVYFVNGNKTVSIRKITTGPSDGQNTVVTSGLQPGDAVVTDGTDRLTDKAKIQISNGRSKGGGKGQGQNGGHGGHGQGSHGGSAPA